MTAACCKETGLEKWGQLLLLHTRNREHSGQSCGCQVARDGDGLWTCLPFYCIPASRDRRGPCSFHIGPLGLFLLFRGQGATCTQLARSQEYMVVAGTLLFSHTAADVSEAGEQQSSSCIYTRKSHPQWENSQTLFSVFRSVKYRVYFHPIHMCE